MTSGATEHDETKIGGDSAHWAAARACHVVHVGAQKRGDPWQAQCPTLSEDDVAAIREASAPWRDLKYVAKRVMHHVHATKQGGVALIYDFVTPSRLVVLPPLNKPFGPLPLDETDASLRALCSDLAESMPNTTAPQPTSWFRRAIIRTGMPVTGVFLFGYLLIHMIGNAHEAPVYVFGMVLAVAVVAVLLMVAKWGEWFLVPGGIAIRTSVPGQVLSRVKLCRPSDSVLIIRREEKLWRASIYRNRLLSSRPVTEFEAAALLAAWQSPLAPPDQDRITDLT